MKELRMSAAERDRLEILGRVKRGEMTLVEASGLMALTLRQARRVWKRFKGEGASGLLHRLRGRVGNRRMPAETAALVVKLKQEKYRDFGPTLACEKLKEVDGIEISPDTLTALLKERGLWERSRRRGKHRRRRDRRSSLGSLVQMDGSHHDDSTELAEVWFEGRGPWCVMMVMIDDATNQTLAWFYPAESTEAAFDVFGRWVAWRGVPRALYVDRHAIYRDEDHPEKPTQFGRAMKELGVELIAAKSPQAKGRVERRHGLFQDRLVKEMRLRGINSITGANSLLAKSFMAEVNRRYAVKPADRKDLHRPVPKGINLDEVLCVAEVRVVGNDWCVRWKNRWLQIDGSEAGRMLPGKKVTVRQRADGTLSLEHAGQKLVFKELSSRPEPARVKPPVVNNKKYKPSASHPWNAPAVDKRKSALPAPHGGPAEQTRKPPER